MDYLLAFSPGLGVTPEAFAAAWNAAPAARAHAEARVVPQAAGHFDPSLGPALVALALALTSGIAGNALYDLINELLPQRPARRSLTIIERELPDGERLLIIHAEEE